MENKVYHLQALTSLHVGNGEAGGVIDMPIAREKASNLPMIPGSGIKGVLRYELEGVTHHSALFGPNTDAAHEHAGALAVGDARLLVLPIRSYKGTFAWATCPMILQRYLRDLEHADRRVNLEVPELKSVDIALTTETCCLGHEQKIYLDDLDLKEQSSSHISQWAEQLASEVFAEDATWRELFLSRFIVLHNDSFGFLAETATEIRARIKIKENTRSVEKGGLWYEEYLPAETLLWGVIATDRSRVRQDTTDAAQLMKHIPLNLRLQIGGNASVGCGQVKWQLTQAVNG